MPPASAMLARTLGPFVYFREWFFEAIERISLELKVLRELTSEEFCSLLRVNSGKKESWGRFEIFEK